MGDRNSSAGRRLGCSGRGALVAILLPLATARGDEQTPDSADASVRSILTESCFPCHGPDEAARRAGLRLDAPEGARARRGGTAAIVPGDPAASLVMQRVLARDPDRRMPPGGELSVEEIEVLRSWIEAGAAWPRHWSLVPPRRPALPEVEDPPWCRDPLDRFVLRGLERRGMAPSPPAEKHEWLRRVSFDLVGLPPTLEELDAFLADESPQAEQRVVDRLLSSPHHGERMAQGWLDLARAADTTGFAADQPRTIWPYRDWVIRAFDQNLPFDRFTVEQLAGDLLPEAREAQHIATGFHRMAMQARGNNPRKEEFRVRGIVDRLDTTARTWLGLTLACAECHDHKYDPISQREYYSLFAIFNNVPHHGEGYGVHGPRRPYLDPARRRELRELDEEIARREREERGAAAGEGDGGRAEWDAASWIGAAPRRVEGPSASVEAYELDGSTARVLVDSADRPVPDAFSLEMWIQTRQPVANLVGKYDWRAGQRSFAFGIGGEAEAGAAPGRLSFWVSGRADPFEGIEVYGSQVVNDGRWHHVAVRFEAGREVALIVDGLEDGAATRRGRVPERVAASDRDWIVAAGTSNSRAPNAFFFEGKLGMPRLWTAPASEALRELRRRRRALMDSAVEAPVMAEREEPRPTFVLRRGNYQDPGERVLPGVPAMLHAFPGEAPLDRLGFARWLVDEANPLTARVVVNRAWQHFFGAGLVRTPDDFGLRGEPPSHPELLDWLAVEFVESGWDHRALIRRIATSATYRQSSRFGETARADPDNRWLARGPRARHQAEQIRDAVLSVSGLLDRRVGGPSVFPPQVAGYWEEKGQTKDSGHWTPSEGPDAYRRSLYVYWKRMALYPSLEIFDAPSRQRCTVQRARTNTPLQALVALNDPVFVEAARAFAARILRESGPSLDDRLRHAYRLALSRPPAAAEAEESAEFLREMIVSFEAEPAAAEALLAVGAAPRGVEASAARLAAWTMLASTLFNLDEMLSKP